MSAGARPGIFARLAAAAFCLTVASGLARAAEKPGRGLVFPRYSAYRAAVAAAQSFEDLRPFMSASQMAEVGVGSRAEQDAALEALRTALASLTNVRPSGKEEVQGDRAWVPLTATYQGMSATGMVILQQEDGGWKFAGEAWEMGRQQMNLNLQLKPVTLSARQTEYKGPPDSETDEPPPARPAKPVRSSKAPLASAARAPQPSVTLTHRTGGVHGATDVKAGAVDTANDVVKVVLDSDGHGLHVVTTTAHPFVDARDGGEVLALYVDADNNPVTGGTETWSDKPGYEFRVHVVVCVRYSDNYGCESTFRKDVRGLHGDIRVDRFEQGDWTPGVTEGLNSPIAGNVLEVRIPYALLGVHAGQVVRVTAVERDTDRSSTASLTSGQLPDATLVLR